MLGARYRATVHLAFILRETLPFARDYRTVTGAFSRKRYHVSDAKQSVPILIPRGRLSPPPIFARAHDITCGTYISVTPRGSVSLDFTIVRVERQSAWPFRPIHFRVAIQRGTE